MKKDNLNKNKCPKIPCHMQDQEQHHPDEHKAESTHF